MHSLFILTIVAVCIGFLCSVGGVDDVSIWVLEFADGIPWSEIYRPAPLPHPMQDFVFRPVSIAMMKGTLFITEGSLDIPGWLVGLKSGVFAWVFGFGAWLWLQQWVEQRVAVLLSVLCMIAEPSLFSAYNYSEFDGFAAGLILCSSWIISQQTLHWALFASIGFCIVFLKESACFIWLCFVLPQLWLGWREEGWTPHLQRYGLIIIVLIACWIFGSSAVIGGKLQSSAGGLSIVERLPVLGFTTWQFVSLWTECGLVLVLGHALRWRWWIVLLWLGVSIWAPMMEINHYETRYYSRPLYVSILTMGMLVYGVFSIGKSTDRFEQEMAWRGGLLIALFGFVILTSSNLREDLASRLFLSLMPGMLLWSWRAFQSCLQKPRRSSVRYMGVLLVSMTLWSLTSGAWNWSQRLWFEQSKHTDWTRQLIVESMKVEGEGSIPVVVTDPSRRYSVRKIESLFPNTSKESLHRLHFESFCYFLSLQEDELPIALQSCFAPVGFSKHDLSRVQFVHRGRRVELSAENVNWLRQDFSWLRGGEGRGAHMPIRLGDTRCTERSLIEDVYDYTYTASDPLYEFLREGFTSTQQLESRYYQIPTRLLNIPSYLVSGASILEPRVFHQSLWVWNGD